MKKESYTLFANSENTYNFVSVGAKGEILKGVYFEEIDTNLYNLVLLDYDPIAKTWSDESVSDNGDIVTVMATIVQIIWLFLNKNNESVVFFKGNTISRQKLYNRIIRNYFVELSEKFVIWGSIEKVQELVIPTKYYQEFYINIK